MSLAASQPMVEGVISQSISAPVTACKAGDAGVIVTATPIYHHLMLGIDLRALTPPDAHEKMIKARAKLGELDCRLCKLARSNDPDMMETLATVKKERCTTMHFMQVLETATGISSLFSPEVYIPPKPASAPPTSISLTFSSGDVATSVNTDKSQNQAQEKRSLEAEPSDSDENSDWTTVGRKQKSDKKAKISKISDEESDMETNIENTNSKSIKKQNIPPFFTIPPPAWHTMISQIIFNRKYI